jgi:hypothetical protein
MAESTLNTKTLDQLIKAFKNKLPTAYVGVLADKNAREGDGSNAAIGWKHEFGEDGLPIRSFLRVPLTNQLQRSLDRKGFFEPNMLQQIAQAGTIESLIQKLGIAGVDTVLEAFKTGGFGMWQPSNMAYKKVHQTLVETGQLRRSIEFEIHYK